MSMLGALTEKPWLTQGPGDERPERSAAAIGLTVFLGVVTVLFSLLTLAYLMRMGTHGPVIAEGGHDWRPVTEPPLLWFNTAVLILTSLAWEGARRLTGLGKTTRMRAWLIGVGALTTIFLAGQIIVWKQLQAAGYFMSIRPGLCGIDWSTADQPLHHFLTGNPAVAFFYLITALHGLHLIGGLLFWGRATVGAFAGEGAATLAPRITLCARYWHFLLLVWLVMFGLFLMT
jgi:cytochrome c oxidase subunit 3